MDCSETECPSGCHATSDDVIHTQVHDRRSEMPEYGGVQLVDDDPRSYQVLSAVFERAGIPLFSARSGDEALRVACQTRPDLVLLDVMMPPGIDGFETLGRMRRLAELKSVPVIFLSSVRRSPERVYGLELG